MRYAGFQETTFVEALFYGAMTAAVVGVILNLAGWFALHTLLLGTGAGLLYYLLFLHGT